MSVERHLGWYYGASPDGCVDFELLARGVDKNSFASRRVNRQGTIEVLRSICSRVASDI